MYLIAANYYNVIKLTKELMQEYLLPIVNLLFSYACSIQ